jgi:hypothetical protein
MNAIAIESPASLGCQELDPSELEELTGGLFPVALYAVGAYLLKTGGDHWGDFKEGVRDGFHAVTS